MIKNPADIEKTDEDAQAEKEYRERIGWEQTERKAANRQLLEDFKSGKIGEDAYLSGVEKSQKETGESVAKKYRTGQRGSAEQKEAVRKLNAEYRESSRDARDRTELRNRITRMTSEMTFKLDYPTKNRHIPVDCIQPCTDIWQMDFSTLVWPISSCLTLPVALISFMRWRRVDGSRCRAFFKKQNLYFLSVFQTINGKSAFKMECFKVKKKTLKTIF